MPARTAFHLGSPNTRRGHRGPPARTQRRTPGSTVTASLEPTADGSADLHDPAGEPFRVASRDRFIPRRRRPRQAPPRISFEVLLALAIVIACMCGAMVVGAAFTIQI
jgi:hypothetical protein